MTPFRQLLAIAARDFVQRARSKSFILTMALIIGLFGVWAGLAASEMNATHSYKIGVTADRDPRLDDALQAMAKAQDQEIDLVVFADAAEAEAAVGEGEVEVALLGSETLQWKSMKNPSLSSLISSAVANVSFADTIANLGLTEDQIAELFTPNTLEDVFVEDVSDEKMARQVAGLIASVLLFMSIMIFGSFILLGVMEEKQSRVVEVLLSRVKPESLLAGKILGIGALGILQLVIIGIAVLVFSQMIDLPEIDLPSLGISTLLWVTLWFVLGFAIYSVLYGSLGAMITRQEDAQSANLIPTMLIMPGYLISFMSIENPESMLMTAASIIPFTSPVVMPARVGAVSVPIWQHVLAISLSLLTTYLLIKIASRIYRGAVLSIGAKVKFKEAWRAQR